MVDPGARSDTTDTPGATTSGFTSLCPGGSSRLEKLATTSSAVAAVPLVALEPTVTTYGSLPGEVTPSLPSFPADTTTVMPAAHAASTAPDNGFSTRCIAPSVSTPNERLSTPMS